MTYEVKIKRIFSLEREELFKYFIQKNLLERWASPDGMELEIPLFEDKIGGRYRYEHSSHDGKYICEGNIKELVPGKRIVQFDKFVKNSEGTIIYENLECVIDLESRPQGTEVTIFQQGFKDEGAAHECQEGWEQSLNKLTHLIREESDEQERIISEGGHDLRT